MDVSRTPALSLGQCSPCSLQISKHATAYRLTFCQMANRDNRADCTTYSVILRYVLNSLRCTVKDWQGYELAQKGTLGLEPIKAHMDTTGQMIQLETQTTSAGSVLNNPAYHSTEVRGCTGTGAPPPPPRTHRTLPAPRCAKNHVMRSLLQW